jgi:hypothetical protein
MVDTLKTQLKSVTRFCEETLNDMEKKTQHLLSEIGVLTKERDEIGVAPHKIVIQESSGDKIPSGRILLDVGGCHFSTTLETLTSVPDSYLERMFSGRFPIKVNEEDGRIFIDRDGTHFNIILTFLRDPQNTKIKIKDRMVLEEFKVEAEFYGLTKAIFGDVDLSIPDPLDWIDNNKIKVHSFSSQLSGFPASNTLNPSVTYWLSESGNITNQWIVYEFPSLSYINKIMIKVDYFECTAKDWMIQTTDDDDPSGEWNTIKEFQARSGYDTTSEQYFEGFEIRAKYVRLYFKNNWGPGGGSYILITLIKFFGGSLED